ncbi:hypothetical protein GW17_00041532 [Ensete ventricosum]|nr:hypothetical protein GW17_00041532 [Ensete ventricosum]
MDSDRSATMPPCASRAGRRPPPSRPVRSLSVSHQYPAVRSSQFPTTDDPRAVETTAGEHEYIDVIIVGERLLVDVDFRSEFQIARSTKSYAAVLQSLPSVFVGKEDRVSQIVAVVSEAARLSLKKKGLYFPPWRKPEYIRSKWLAPFERSTTPSDHKQAVEETRASEEKAKTENPRGDASTTDHEPVVRDPKQPTEAVKETGSLGEKTKTENPSGDNFPSTDEPREAAEGKSTVVAASAPPTWELPEVKPRTPHKGAKVVTGLASVLSENP